MKRSIRTWFLMMMSAMALFAAACGDADDSAGDGDGDAAGAGGSVVVGSANFAEQEILASMYAEVLEDAGFDVERRFQLGARDVVYPALQSGEIDVTPEYVGTLLEFLNGGAGEATADTDASLELLQVELEAEGLVALEPADAQDKNALVVTQETADELGLATVSDLDGQAGDLVLGGPPECPQRPLCLPGYEEVYGLSFGDFVPLDAGGPLTVESLGGGDIDVALMFSSQGVIGDMGWVILEDDQGLQPAENLLPVVREEILTDELRAAIDAVSAVLTDEVLIALNARVDVDGEDPAAVAESFLIEEGIIDG